MKKFLAVVAVIALAACSNGTISGPTTTEDQTEVVAAAPATTPVAQPVAEPGTEGATVVFGSNASWDIRGATRKTYTYRTSFDDQSKALEVSQDLIGSFHQGCLQLDVSYEPTVVGGVGGRPFAHAYYDQDGKKVKGAVTDEIRKACSPEPKCVDEVTYEWADPRYVVTSLSDAGSTYGVYVEGVLVSPEFSHTPLPLNFSYPNNGNTLCLKFRHPAVPAVSSDTNRANICAANGGTWLNDFNIPDDDSDCETDDEDYSGSTCPNVCRTSTSTNIIVTGVQDDDRYNENDNSNRYWDLSGIGGIAAIPETLESVSGTCEVATCGLQAGDVNAAWHGTAEFQCDRVEHHSCEQTD